MNPDREAVPQPGQVVANEHPVRRPEPRAQLVPIRDSDQRTSNPELDRVASDRDIQDNGRARLVLNIESQFLLGHQIPVIPPMEGGAGGGAGSRHHRLCRSMYHP
jgi:hypothetical protein